MFGAFEDEPSDDNEVSDEHEDPMVTEVPPGHLQSKDPLAVRRIHFPSHRGYTKEAEACGLGHCLSFPCLATS